MKKVESIWAELSAKAQEVAQESTELSEEVKVELGAKDMYNTSQNLAKAVSQMEFSSQLGAMESGIKSALKVAKKLLTELEADMKDFRSKSDELGIDANSNDLYRTVNKYYDDAVKDINKGERLLDAIQKLG
jgi:hypothetical protein